MTALQKVLLVIGAGMAAPAFAFRPLPPAQTPLILQMEQWIAQAELDRVLIPEGGFAFQAEIDAINDSIPVIYRHPDWMTDFSVKCWLEDQLWAEQATALMMFQYAKLLGAHDYAEYYFSYFDTLGAVCSSIDAWPGTGGPVVSCGATRSGARW